MNEQKIIIVGASSGIGRRMAELYIEKGSYVGVTGRRRLLLEEIKNQFPQQAEYECFDVTGSNNISHIKSLVARLGGLDILIISAGIGEPAKELSWEIDKTTVGTNVNGFVEIANWAFNYFNKQGHGRLANISSIAAVRGGSWAPAYNASKAFQSSYFEGLAFKAAKLGAKSTGPKISVTSIEPGFLDTKMAKSDKLFWVIPVDKAARRAIRAIEKRKRRSHLSLRWWFVAKVLKWMPHWLYRKLA